MCDVEMERCDTIGMNDELKPAARIALIMVRRRPELEFSRLTAADELVEADRDFSTEIESSYTVYGVCGAIILMTSSSSIHRAPGLRCGRPRSDDINYARLCCRSRIVLGV